MFHVFALTYVTTGFLRPTLICYTVLQATSTRVYHDVSMSVYYNTSVYAVPLCMRGASTFAFKYFLIIYRYAKQSGTRNMFLFLVL